MLTKEMCKGINNKIKGTGKRLHEVEKMYDTLTNSANGFLGATARVDEIPYVEQPTRYKIVKPIIIEEPVITDIKENKTDFEIEVPYFNTLFYKECKVIADSTNKNVDDVAWEQVAKQLNVSVQRAIVLVSNGLVKISF